MIDYERIVEETVAELPPQIQKRIRDVEIVIDKEKPPNPYILGFYQGVPVKRDPSRRAFYPHRIFLYIENIKRYAKNVDNLKTIIKMVLKHEIGHHIGFSDQKLTDLGY